MKKNDKGVLIRLFSELKPFKKSILIAFVYFFCISFVAFLKPLIIKHITDDGLLSKKIKIVIVFSCIYFLLSCIEEFTEVYQTKTFVRIQNKLKYGLYERSFIKLTKLKQSYFSDKNSADIINILTTDVNIIGIIADKSILFLFTYSLRIISGLLGLFYIDWHLALLVLGCVPIKYIIVKVFAKKKRKTVEAYIESYQEFDGWLGDAINGIREIKLWNLLTHKITEFRKKQEVILKTNEQQCMLETYNSLADSLLQMMLTSTVYILGGILIIQSKLSLGDITAFLTYTAYVIAPISLLFNIKMIFSGVVPSAIRYYEFQDLEEEAEGGASIHKEMGFQSLEFQNVSFAYGDRIVLNGIGFSIKKGEKIAIIGENGSGKTTIINLMLRLLEPTGGHITLNDSIDIDDFKISDYRSIYSVVSQDPYLFQNSIYENIALYQDFDKADFSKICFQCRLNDWISRLDAKEQTFVGRNGTTVSGGEKQKIAVARALLRDSEVIILDEATSSFDSESDRLVHQMILEEFADKTVVCITHHQEHLKYMDRIYQIENQKIQEVTERFIKRG